MSGIGRGHVNEETEVKFRAVNGAAMAAYISTSSNVDIQIETIQGKRRISVAYTMDTTEAFQLVDWLNAWLKTQQDAYAQSLLDAANWEKPAEVDA